MQFILKFFSCQETHATNYLKSLNKWKKILKTFNTKKDLVNHLLTRTPSFYMASQTSTVIPYTKLDTILKSTPCKLSLPVSLSVDKKNMTLSVSGPVTWKEARAECRSMGLDLMTAPTEELASILAGIATSATGERSFGYGPLRDQVLSVTYLNYLGDEKTLTSEKRLTGGDYYPKYQKSFEPYVQFKNGPFPRYERETDLMVGSEGQLGVIVSATIKLIPSPRVQFMAIKLPSWREDFSPHVEIYNKVQALRGKIIGCEILDAESISYLPSDQRAFENQDVIMLEVLVEHFDEVYESLLSSLIFTEAESIVSMDERKAHEFRMSVPRAIFEANEKAGVTKKGTDVQVAPENFVKLLHHYQTLSKESIPSVLFGHFGDAHLHFNFMPTPKESDFVDQIFNDLYDQVVIWKGSPFAEHGVGVLKRPYIKRFYKKEQTDLFAYFKRQHDPHNQFFPEGFMSLKGGK